MKPIEDPKDPFKKEVINVFDTNTNKFRKKEIDYINVFDPFTNTFKKDRDPYNLKFKDQAYLVDPYLKREFNELGYLPNQEEIANSETANKILHDEMGGWKRLKETVGSFYDQGRAGLLMGIAQYQMGDGIDMIRGVEKDYSNTLYTMAQNILKSAQLDHNIRELKPGGFNPSDPAWWSNQFASLGLSTGLMIPGLIESTLLTAITAPLGGVGLYKGAADIFKAAKQFKMLTALKETAKYLSTSAVKSQIRNHALLGLVKGTQEGIIEGYESFYNTKDNLIKQGVREEDANKFASIAASTTYRNGVLPLMLMNSIQYATLGFNPITGAAKGALKKGFMNNVKNWGIQAVTEGTEEVFQELAQQEGEYAANKAAEMATSNKGFLGRQLEGLGKARTWNAAVGGALGGSMFFLGGKVKDKILSKYHKDGLLTQHGEFIDKMQSENLAHLEKINKLDKEGKFEESNMERRNMSITMGVNALLLDDATEKTTAVDGYENYLSNTLNYVNTNDKERLAELGIKEDSHDYIKQRFPQYLQDFQEIKKIYEEEKSNGTDVSVLPNMVSTRFTIKDLDRYSGELDKNKSDILNKQFFKDLPANDRELLQIQIEKDVLESLAVKGEGLSTTQIARLKELKEKFDELTYSIEGLQMISANEDTRNKLARIETHKALIPRVKLNLYKKVSFLKEAVVHQSYEAESLLEEIKNATPERLQELKRDGNLEVNKFKEADRKRIVKAIEEKEIDLNTDVALGKQEIEDNKKQAENPVVVEDTEVVEPKNEKVVKAKDILKNNLKKGGLVKETKANTAEQNVSEADFSEKGAVVKASDFTGKKKEEPKVDDYLVEEGLVFYKNSDGTLVPIPNPEKKPVADIINADKEKRKEKVNPQINELITLDPTTKELEDYFNDVLEYFNKYEDNKTPTWEQVENLLQELNVKGKIISDLKDIYISKSSLIAQGKLRASGATLMSKYETEIDVEEYGKDNSDGKILEADVNKVKIQGDGRKHVLPDARVSFFSVDFEQKTNDEGKVVNVSTGIHQDPFIDNFYHLDPFNLQIGDELEIVIDENADDVNVSQWIGENKRGTEVSFGSLRLEKGSQAWVDKVPLAVYPVRDGKRLTEKPIGRIHDLEHFNSTTVADFAGDSDKQYEIIQESKVNYRALRNRVFKEGKIQTKIKNRKVTVVETVKESVGEQLIPINQTDTKFAKCTSNGIVKYKDGINESKDTFVYTFKVNDGQLLSLRPIGKNKHGGTEYRAFKLNYPKLEDSQEVMTTIVQAIRKRVEAIRNGTNAPLGKLDLRDAADFNKYLSNFLIIRPTPSSTKAIEGDKNSPSASRVIQILTNTMVTDEKGKTGSPYIWFINGSIFYGRKNQGHAKMIGKENFESDLNSFQEFLVGGEESFEIKNGEKHTTTTKILLGIDHDAYDNKYPVPFIDKSGNVYTKDLRDFYRSVLMTNIKSFNIGTEDKPKWTSVVQPQIYLEDIEVSKSDNVVSEEEQKTDDIGPNIENPMLDDDILEGLKKDIDYYESIGDLVTANKLREIANIQKNVEEEVDEDDMFKDPITTKTVSTESKDRIKESMDNIPDIDFREQAQITNFLFHLYFTDSTNAKNTLLDRVNNYIDKLSEIVANHKNLIENRGITGLTDLVIENENNIKKAKSFITNIDKIESEAKIKFTKYTKIKEIEDELIPDYEDQEIVEKNYNSKSYEGGQKKKTSLLLKRFYEGIEKKDPKGNPLKGIFGLELYENFDEIDDIVKTILTSPQEMSTSFDEMMVQLEEYKDAYPWMKELVDKLNIADDTLKATFVSENHKHNMSMLFVMFSENEHGYFTLETYYTNASSVEDTLINTWRSNTFNTNLIFYNTADNKWELNLKHLDSRIREIARKLDIDDKLPINKLVDEIKNSFVEDKWKDVDSYKQSKEVALEIELKNRIVKRLKTELPGKAYSKNDVLLEFLDIFGIKLSKKALLDLERKGMYTLNGVGVSEKFAYNQMFDIKDNSAVIFGHLLYKVKDYFTNNPNKESIDLGERDSNHPLYNSHTRLKKLARLESKHSLYTSVSSFRDGGKLINGKPLHKLASEQVRRLKEDDGEYRKFLMEKSFNGNSIYLKALDDSNAKFRKEIFNLFHVPNSTLKELGKKWLNSSGLTSLSDMDLEYLTFGYFNDTNTPEISFDYKGFTDFKIARFLAPSLSDKDQAVGLPGIALNIKRKHFSNAKEIKGLSDDVLNILYDQIVEPDFKRILEFFNKETDIEGFEVGSKLFLLFPTINNIEFNGLKLSTYLTTEDAKKKETITSMINSEEFQAIFKNSAKKEIERLLSEEVDNKLELWGKYFNVDNSEPTKKKFDSKYLENTGGDFNTRYRISAYDFLINYYIAQANMSMLLYGDMALYVPNSEKLSLTDIRKASENNTLLPIIKTQILDNLSKRLALVIAPSKKLMNSKGDKYLQLFLEDRVSVSSTVKHLSSVLDDKEITDKEIEVIDRFNNGEKGLKSVINKIKEKYPKSSYFFSIKTTDAQEYTTVKEHLEVLHRIGYIPQSIYDSIKGKIRDQRDFIEKNPGQKIPEKYYLGTEEMKFFYNPVKPIYAGMINDTLNNVARTVYIKSSSFPLLPQITQNNELDKLRVMMEKLEMETGKNVRASYSTANKVGGLVNSLKVFNSDNTFNDNLTIEDFQNHTLELSREDFGIQQDTPTHFDKNIRDEISLGTQLLKILFGNGVLDINNFNYKSNFYSDEDILKILETDKINLASGKNLHKLFDKSWLDLIDLNRKSILNEFHLNDDFTSKDYFKTLSKIEDILIKEANLRDFTKYDKEALKMVAKVNLSVNGQVLKDKDGNNASVSILNSTIKEIQKGNYSALIKFFNEKIDKVEILGIEDINFNLPIWSHPKSDNFEALLNSIVSKRMINVKIPGDSYILGSEAGMKLSKDITGYDSSKIVYTKHFDFEKGKLQHTRIEKRKNEKGDIERIHHGSQVFIPGRFRDNAGNIIKFINDDGTINPKYVEEKDGVLLLKDGVLDDMLLNFTSFRIPTSGHVSVSQFEIAGFLPVEAGELMILNESLIAQKGLDFDVDKEYGYKLNTYVDSEGNISVLNRQSVIDINKRIEDNNEFRRDLYENFTNLLDERDKTLDINLFEGIDTKVLESINQDIIDAGEDIDRNITQEAYYKIFKKQFLSNQDKRLLENEIIGITSAVFSNPDSEMQKKIVKSLNMDYSKSQSNLIANSLPSKSFTNFTPLSHEYQKEIMYQGATGKLAIGVYSNFLTQHHLLQQYKGKYYKEFEIGNFSKNSLGNNYIIEPKEIPSKLWNRIKVSISEIFEEKQNTATDNQKEGILGIVGVNKYTINVEAFLSALGNEKDFYEITEAEYNDNKLGTDYEVDGKFYRVVSFPYLFVSQPIIKEFCRRIAEKESIITEYSDNSADKVYEDLMNEGDNAPSTLYDDDSLKAEYGEYFSEMKGEQLVEELKSDTTKEFSTFQKAILYKFMELRKHSRDFSRFQSYLNITKDGLGKSRFDNIDRKEFLEAYMGKRTNFDFSKLIGNFKLLKNTTQKEVDSYTSSGYVHVGNAPTGEVVVIQPTTPMGSLLVNGTMTGYNLWKNYFPYDSDYIARIFNSIKKDVIKGDDYSSIVEINKDIQIFREFKKAINSIGSKTFNGETASDIRRRLLNDTKTNMSLGRYLRDNMANESFKSFALIRSLAFKSDIVGTRIEYNNSKEDSFDNDYIYQSIPDMIINNKSLPDFNGKTYTTEQLAIDLISYAFATGGIQEAVQFIKYIPINILKEFPFIMQMRAIDMGLKSGTFNFKDVLDNETSIEVLFDRFHEQYIQHHPENVFKLSLDSKDIIYPVGSGTKLESFQVSSKISSLPSYISIYNPFLTKGGHKAMLFKLSDETYKRISTLGYETISEYDLYTKDAQSLFNSNYINISKERVEPVENSKRNANASKAFGIKDKKTLPEIVDNIINSKFTTLPYIKDLFQLLKDNNLIIDVPIEFKETNEFNGGYNNGKIYLAEHIFREKTDEEIAKILLKEYIHRLTVQELGEYFTRNGLKNGFDAPTWVHSLWRTYQAYLKNEKITPKKLLEIKSRESFTAEERITLYPASDIFEFVEAFFTEPGFQQRVNKIPFNSTNKTLEDKLFEALSRIFEYLTGSPILQETFSNIMEIAKIEVAKVDDIETAVNKVNNNENIKLDDTFDNFIEEAKGQERTIAIIGTAGRSQVPTLQEWNNMLRDAESKVKPNDTLISGGAAFADHVAVKLFLEGKVKGLKLRLPAKIENNRFVGKYGTAGGTANYYHDKFSKVIGTDTITEIQQAIDKGAEVTYETELSNKAMFIRNEKVANESDSMIAYTYGEDNEPADGGTKDTWNKAKYTDKVHVSIHKIQVEKPKSGLFKPTKNPNIDLNDFKDPMVIKEGVQEVFKKNPELASIGSEQQYSVYLDSIFPNSKMKDIVYHGTKSKNRLEIFDENQIGALDSGYFGRGFYLTPDKQYASNYIGTEGHIESLIVNVQNPLETDMNKANTNISLNNNDSAIVTFGEDLAGLNEVYQNPNEIAEIVIKESNQIHILGSKQDIEEFKKFVSNSQQNTLSLSNLIESGEIQFLDEDYNVCAAMGLTNTTTGTNWRIVKDFKGKPKHSQGGVDITISNKGVNIRRGGKDIKAEFGLVIENIK